MVEIDLSDVIILAFEREREKKKENIAIGLNSLCTSILQGDRRRLADAGLVLGRWGAKAKL
jgi:hypothetical protein